MRYWRVPFIVLLAACLAAPAIGLGSGGISLPILPGNNTAFTFPLAEKNAVPDMASAGIGADGVGGDLLARKIEIGIPAMGADLTKSGTGANNTSPRGNTQTRHPRVDPKSTKEQIRNMSDMKRIYRNAFVGSTMHKAYEGPTQYPAWIDPYDKGQGVFNQINMSVILNNSRAMTQAGKHLCPVFWDL